MNLEKLNKEFDEYLDEFQVVDSFSTSRVMTFQKKKKRFLLPIISICSILVIVFFVGKELLPVNDTPNNSVVEMIELENHPWYVACQFHPEFKSRPNRPHPLFLGFINAAVTK